MTGWLPAASLPATASLAVLLLAGALLLWPPPPGVLDRLAPGHAPGARVGGGREERAGPPSAVRRWGVAGTAGTVVLVLGGVGPGALLLATGVAVGVERWSRRAWAPPDERGRVREDLPVVCDLLAVCLASGTPVSAAVAGVGTAVGGPLGDALDGVAARLRLGARARDAWAGVPEDAAALARVVVRAGESGSSIVPALQGLAADRRVAERAATTAAVQKAGVWVLAPLGLCFLPAFLCLGVVPLVLGIAAAVLG